MAASLMKNFSMVRNFPNSKNWNFVKIFVLFLENGRNFFREIFGIVRGLVSITVFFESGSAIKFERSGGGFSIGLSFE